MKTCTDRSHRSVSRYRERAWVCGHAFCRGIRTDLHHAEETQRDNLEWEHAWQRHYGLPLTPLRRVMAMNR